jgi:FAD/FMN-containing dehydrogenase
MLVDQLKNALGERCILTGPAETQAFTEDWRGRYRGSALCVALPATTDEVSKIVQLCAAAGVSIIAQGGNTSLCGGAVPDSNAPPPVIVNLQRMRRIRSIDLANNAICVDAGCVLATVQQTAAENGRLFPISLGAEGSCQIGGAIATNAGGTGVLRYGNMRDNVLGLEVVLPDGRVWNGLYALRKNNTGYDLKHLFIGSEGTLGIVTAAVLKLHPLPTARSIAWLGVESPQVALEILKLFRGSCESRLSGFELMNENQVDLVIQHVPNRRCPLNDHPSWHVLVELSDTSDATALDQEMQTVLQRAFEHNLLADAVIATSEAQGVAMWEFRHSVSEANKKGGIGLTTDCAVPVSAVPTFIEDATANVRANVPELPVVVVAHLGDGNVHFIPFFSFEQWKKVADQEKLSEQIRSIVNQTAVALGGTFSAEHGIVRTLVGDMARHKSSIELSMMQVIKQALDPKNLSNPGRLLP